MMKCMFFSKKSSLPTHRVEGIDLVFSHKIDSGSETYSTLLTERAEIFELRIVIIASKHLVKCALYYKDTPIVGHDAYIKYSKIKYLLNNHYILTLPNVIDVINKTYFDYQEIDIDNVRTLFLSARENMHCQLLFNSYEKEHYHVYGCQHTLKLTPFNHKLVKFNFIQDYYVKDNSSLERNRHLFYRLNEKLFFKKINVFYYFRKKFAHLDTIGFNSLIKPILSPMANKFEINIEYDQFWYCSELSDKNDYLLGIINIEKKLVSLKRSAIGRVNMYTGMRSVVNDLSQDNRYINLYYLLDRREKKLTINYLFLEDKEKPVTEDYYSEVIDYTDESELAILFSYFMLSKAYQHVKIRDEVKAILGETDTITSHHFDLLEMVDL